MSVHELLPPLPPADHFTASLAAAAERSTIRGEAAAAAAAFALNMCDETLFAYQKRGFNVF
jgi:hypothetical protein